MPNILWNRIRSYWIVREEYIFDISRFRYDRQVDASIEIRGVWIIGYGELRGKRLGVPINIGTQGIIYVDNIHTKHAYH